ncbi:MAG TPA: glycosyltransferase family A protein [Pyrinomonadaceae bacterium]|nr:glycosyltransferase family A protein [Pyrinomonadaceae bacterium]
MTATCTVAIPVYRGGLFLEESLASVKAQTYSHFEVIMSLDGPDPECEEICRGFLSDSRFRLVIQPHRLGWMAHTNWLISQVQTEFWHLQEQDDLIDPIFLETLIEYAHKHPAIAAVFGDVRTFGTFGSHITMSSVLGTPVLRELKLIHEHFQGVAPLGVVRSEALHITGGLRANEFENFAADTALMAGLARWGELHRIPLELYHKRVHEASTHATWWKWDRVTRIKAWQVHCLDMLQHALQIDSSPQDRSLIWLAVVERLVSPLIAAHFIQTEELTLGEREDMLDSFLQQVSDSSLDISASLATSWDDIVHWTQNFFWLGSVRNAPRGEDLARSHL